MMHIKRRMPRPCYINRAGLNEQQALARRAGCTAERLQIVQVMPIVSFAPYMSKRQRRCLWRSIMGQGFGEHCFAVAACAPVASGDGDDIAHGRPGFVGCCAG
jgi:hypothetical protein